MTLPLKNLKRRQVKGSDLNKFSSRPKKVVPEEVDLFDLVKQSVNPQIGGDAAPNTFFIRKQTLFTYVWNATSLGAMGNEIVGEVNFAVPELDGLAGNRIKNIRYALAVMIDDSFPNTTRAVVDSCDGYIQSANGNMALGADGIDFEYNGSPIIDTNNTYTFNLRLRFDRSIALVATNQVRYFVYLSLIIEYYP